MSRAPARPSVAVIGAGSMGRNHARVIAQSERADLQLIVDPDLDVARSLAYEYRGNAVPQLEPPFRFDIAVVAAPTQHHREIADQLLQAGIPVLVEKPLAPEIESVETIIASARRTGMPLVCGFVERFNPVVAAARAATGGQAIRHMVAVRHSPPAPRIEVDVIQDLLIHDIDLACQLARSQQAQILASGWEARPGMLEVADAVLTFDSGALASLSADRWSQRKVRQLSISTDSALFELDLLRHDLTVYRHRSHELVEGGGYRSETVMDIPFVRHAGEPLALQFDHFLDLLVDSANRDAELASYELPHVLAAQVSSQLSGR